MDDLNHKNNEEREDVMKYVCSCGWEYDEAVGVPKDNIKPGTAWEDVPEDFTCPLCGLGKDAFSRE